MSNYTIVSERVGTPGEPFTPEEGVNVEALIAHGFIKQAAKKSGKMTSDDSEQENQ